MANQVNAITRALGDAPVPITPALCFVEAQGGIFAGPFVVDDVWIGTPAALPGLVTKPGLLDAEAIGTTAQLLGPRLPVA